MAGECPHITLLETTLRQCPENLPVTASAHESYLKIIDDFKNDLEQISCEAIMVQNECSNQTDNVDLENFLRELETQNDRLEQALKLQTQIKETALTELQTNNETLKCQIDHLQQKVLEKDRDIVCLSSMLKNSSHIQSAEPKQAALEYVTSRNNFSTGLEKKIQTLSEKLDKSTRQEQFLHRETRKLTEELNESRRKNRDLIAQAHRLSNLLKCQESHSMEFAAKYEALEQNYEDQAKKLRTANNQLRILEDRFQLMEKRQIEHNLERNLLREEVLSLKEKHACAMGRKKSIQEQQIRTEKELCKAHDVIKEQNFIMQRNEIVHSEQTQRLQETNVQLRRELSDLAKDYKKLKEEHDNQKEVSSQQLKLLENFRKWKEQQIKAENCTRESIKSYQDYITDMMEHNQILSKKFHDLYRDHNQLQYELERLKMCPLSLPNSNSFSNISERSIAERLEVVRRTTCRVSEQSSSLKDEEPNISRGDSSSAFRPNEEPL